MENARRSPTGQKPGRARQLDADQVQELIAGYQAGATVYELGDRDSPTAQIAAQVKTDQRTVQRRLGERGVKMRDTHGRPRS